MIMNLYKEAIKQLLLESKIILFRYKLHPPTNGIKDKKRKSHEFIKQYFNLQK